MCCEPSFFSFVINVFAAQALAVMLALMALVNRADTLPLVNSDTFVPVVNDFESHSQLNVTNS